MNQAFSFLLWNFKNFFFYKIGKKMKKMSYSIHLKPMFWLIPDTRKFNFGYHPIHQWRCLQHRISALHGGLIQIKQRVFFHILDLFRRILIVSKGQKRISKIKFLKMEDGLAIMPVKMSIICRIFKFDTCSGFCNKNYNFCRKISSLTVSISTRLGKKDHFLDPISQYRVLYHPPSSWS